MDNTLNTIFLGNTLISWLISLTLLIGLIVVIRFFKSIVISKAKAWSVTTFNSWDNYLVDQIERSVIPMSYIGSAYMALSVLTLDVRVTKVADVAFIVALSFFALRILSSAFRKFVFSFIQTQENSGAKKKQADGLMLIINIMIWVVGIIFTIDNLGFDVTSLLAGLGIGGIAIALAAQAILGDLFSYFVIFFDRPFEIGDFIVVDDKSGEVESIGVKTTRIRTLSGEQLVCSNTDLTNSRLHNYKKLLRRRVLFNLGVTYQTSHQLLSEIPGVIRQIIQSKSHVTFDRAHFSGYGDFSLNFEIVFYVVDPDYAVYMDKQQAIYLDIYEAFQKRGIEFAYPTQTLMVQLENESVR